VKMAYEKGCDALDPDNVGMFEFIRSKLF
jgi:hypothetical protein